MKKYFYILFALILNVNLSGQTIYDTIPENKEESHIGRSVPEKIMIFRDFNAQLKAFFDSLDFNKLDCYGNRGRIPRRSRPLADPHSGSRGVVPVNRGSFLTIKPGNEISDR